MYIIWPSILLSFFCTLSYAGNDRTFQPKSLVTTCFIIAAKHCDKIIEDNCCPTDIQDPLMALYQVHHDQEFQEEHLKEAFNICVPSPIKEHYSDYQDELNTICWIIKYDAKNNIHNALILIPSYTQKLLPNKRFAIISLLSLGAHINAKGTIKDIEDITPLVNAITVKSPHIVRLLISKGAKVNQKSIGKTPLQHARDHSTKKHDFNNQAGIINSEEIIEILYKNDAEGLEEKVLIPTPNYRFCYLI